MCTVPRSSNPGRLLTAAARTLKPKGATGHSRYRPPSEASSSTAKEAQPGVLGGPNANAVSRGGHAAPEERRPRRPREACKGVCVGGGEYVGMLGAMGHTNIMEQSTVPL